MENYDFEKVENEILNYWAENKIYEKVKEFRKSGKPFYFLDGPPYTSGKVHVGTAWNKSLKDMVLRLKRMKGYDVWDRAGYDMHGLPTENATEKKLGIKGKEAIKEYGVDKFVAECKKLCIDNMKVMNQDFKRMGVWMDFDNAYQSITDEFIEGEWWLVKKAHEKGRLYEGLKTMTWCPSCASALAKHECEYQDVLDESIFVKFQIKGSDNEFLVIWTTTPWTIPFNLAVMVGPEIDYVKIKLSFNNKEQVWIVAEELLSNLLSAVGFEEPDMAIEKGEVEIIDRFKGESLEGIKYIHPFSEGKFKITDYEELAKKHDKLHSVILSKEYVDTSAGTGLVHCAPGCGPEDYEVGLKNGLPPYNTIDQYGVFPEKMGLFSGKVAKKDDPFFIEALDETGALLARKQVGHDYAHCWRCKSPVVFRTTKQWFFKIEDIKERLIEENNKISWVPKAAYNAFDSWLRNLRDNSITKQRFWGTPLPVWKCESEECGYYEVIGSKAELKEKAGRLPKDLHKPFIDEITWSCPKCGGLMKRIPDILDVWVDAGTTSWNCLNYPHEDALFKKLFPADFILEGKDQIRGWFNLLHLSSMISMDRPSFKACYMHGFVNDSQGRKMSKSLGNYILPSEIIDKYGADTMRYYMIGAANPGLDMSYNMSDVENKHRNLFVFWNIGKFLSQIVPDGYSLPSLAELKDLDLGIEERFILSKLNSMIKKVDQLLAGYYLNEIPLVIEDFLFSLSRDYIKVVREKAQSDEGRSIVLAVAGRAYFEALKLFSAVTPMFCEKIYLSIKDLFGFSKESIFFFDFPEFDEEMIDERLEEDYKVAFQVIGAILSARDSARLGLRWPLSKALVQTDDEGVRKVLSSMADLIKSQANIKSLEEGAPEFRYKIKLNFKSVGADFGHDTADIATYVKQHLDVVEDAFNEAFLVKGLDSFKVDRWEMKKDHFIAEKVMPENWASGEFNKGSAYIFTELSPELEEEGYLRELTRRFQQLRKDALLNKSDLVDFSFSGDLADLVSKNRSSLLQVIGARDLLIVDDPAHHFDFKRSFSVKGKEFTIGLKKVD